MAKYYAPEFTFYICQTSPKASAQGFLCIFVSIFARKGVVAV